MRSARLAAVVASLTACGTGGPAVPVAAAAGPHAGTVLASAGGDWAAGEDGVSASRDATVQEAGVSDGPQDAVTETSDVRESPPGTLGSPAPAPVPTGCVTDV